MVAKVEVMVEVEAVEVEVMVEVEVLHMVSCLQPNFGFALRLWFLTFHVPELYFDVATSEQLISSFVLKKAHPFQKSGGTRFAWCFRLGR